MPTHLTFNSDEAFDSRKNMDDSQFKEYVTEMMVPRIKSHFSVEDAELDSFLVNDEKALLYDRKTLTYG